MTTPEATTPETFSIYFRPEPSHTFTRIGYGYPSSGEAIAQLRRRVATGDFPFEQYPDAAFRVVNLSTGRGYQMGYSKTRTLTDPSVIWRMFQK